MQLGERLEELVVSVLLPLLVGGTLTPVRPIGARIALAIPDGLIVSQPGVRSAVDVARVRRARLLVPVDTLDEITAAEWALVAALNDLLQASNHELTSIATKGRRRKLLENTASLLAAIPKPQTIREVVARHATFGRTLELTRTDVDVRWWTGRRQFRGQEPPARLMRWREFRRVTVDKQQVRLFDMARDLPDVSLLFAEVLGAWLLHNPLTDLATSARSHPKFCWTTTTLSLVATPVGQTLARRAMMQQPVHVMLDALKDATKSLPKKGSKPARRAAKHFQQQLVEFAMLSDAS